MLHEGAGAFETGVAVALPQASAMMRSTRSVASDGGVVRVGTTRVVRCAADRAGLGRFVYLTGASGRRYVFCGIEGDRARLYDRAVFGLRDGDGMTLAPRAGTLRGRAGLLYVHLLDDGGPDAEAVLADLA